MYAFFVLQCTVFGRKSKHKTDVTAWHGIHFHKNNLWNILVIGIYYVNYQNYQNEMLLILDEHWCIYSCLQIPPRENWFQYVRTQRTRNSNELSLHYYLDQSQLTNIFPDWKFEMLKLSWFPMKYLSFLNKYSLQWIFVDGVGFFSFEKLEFLLIDNFSWINFCLMNRMLSLNNYQFVNITCSWKKLNSCNKLIFSNPYIFAIHRYSYR